MSGIFGETLAFGQENGPDIELVVYGDEFYARYETEDGYTVVYDAALGRYCHAVVRKGEFVSTGIPATEPPPPGTLPHLKESDGVRQAKAAAKAAARNAPHNES